MQGFRSFYESSAGRTFNRLPVAGILDRIGVEKMPWSQELHPEFFEGKKLRPVMAAAMNRMVDGFLKVTGIPRKQILDIMFKGSMAGYNYTKESDIDLQVILRYNWEKNPDRSKDDPLGRDLRDEYNKIRAAYNQSHHLTLGTQKYPVEFFIHTPKTNVATGASARWSLKKNDWIPGYEPTQNIETPKKKRINTIFKAYYNLIKKTYISTLKSGASKLDALQAAYGLLKDIAIKERNTVLHAPGVSKRADVESPTNLAFKALKRTNLVAYIETSLKKHSVNESNFDVEAEIRFIESFNEA